MGSRPTKDTLNAASFPVLILIGFVNAVRSSAFILGGSSRKKNASFQTFIAKLKKKTILF